MEFDNGTTSQMKITIYNGATWDTYDISALVTEPFTRVPSLAVLPNGNLGCTYCKDYSVADSYDNIFFHESLDNGVTWGSEILISEHNVGQHNGQHASPGNG